MLEEMIVPLVGFFLTAIGLALFYFIKYFQIRRDGYQEIEDPPPPPLCLEEDVKVLCRRYRKLGQDLKALQDEGFALRDFLNRMKKIALLVDKNAIYLDEETDIYRSAYAAFTALCRQKREVENCARYRENFKDKFRHTQIKILQILPREMFFSNRRMFLPPSPLNRVSILVRHVKALRGVHQKRVMNEKEVMARKRHLMPSQLSYDKRQKKAKTDGSVPECLDEAKKRIRSMASDETRFQPGQTIKSEKTKKYDSA